MFLALCLLVEGVKKCVYGSGSFRARLKHCEGVEKGVRGST